MQDFLDSAFSFPTVVYTVLSIVLIGFWTVTTVIGAGADAFEDVDFDFDADTDVDLDVDVSASGQSNSLLRSALEFLGVGNMPLLLALGLESLLAWLTSIVLVTIVGDVTGATGTVVNLAILIASLLLGVWVTAWFGRRYAHVFRPTHAAKQREFVGSVCTITTDKVSETFGQAEVRDDEGGSLLLQVRCRHENDFRSGDRALIYDLDRETGEFHISADRSLAM